MKEAAIERIVRSALFLCAISAALILSFIVFFLVKESFLFLSTGDILGFLTGTKWKPQDNIYGAGIFVAGSILTTLGSLLIAVPFGLACAIFLSEVAPKKAAAIVRPAIELLAGIPSVVYGLFALVVIVGFIQTDLGRLVSGDVLPTGKGILAASLIIGIIILPIVISISQDAINSVPRAFREGSYALGSTKWQTIIKVVVPAAMPGIAAGVILGVGRAIGETMAVVLVLGNVGMIPSNIIGPGSRGETLTSAIMLEMSYASVGSMHYAALFTLGLALFVMAFILSVASEYVVSNRGRAK
jgi:phosphate ABC transporter permease protein PstC